MKTSQNMTKKKSTVSVWGTIINFDSGMYSFFFFFLELNKKPNVTKKPGPALNDEESKRFTNPTAGEAVECCQSLTWESDWFDESLMSHDICAGPLRVWISRGSSHPSVPVSSLALRYFQVLKHSTAPGVWRTHILLACCCSRCSLLGDPLWITAKPAGKGPNLTSLTLGRNTGGGLWN